MAVSIPEFRGALITLAKKTLRCTNTRVRTVASEKDSFMCVDATLKNAQSAVGKPLLVIVPMIALMGGTHNNRINLTRISRVRGWGKMVPAQAMQIVPSRADSRSGTTRSSRQPRWPLRLSFSLGKNIGTSNHVVRLIQNRYNKSGV